MVENEEALFQGVIRQLPSVTEPQQLFECSTLALALLLRRAGDTELRDALTRMIHEIVDEIQVHQSAERTANQVRFAARQCVKVLKAARDGRLPRDPASVGGWVQSAPAAPSSQSPKPNRARNMAVLALVALVLLAGAGAFLSSNRDQDLGEADQSADAPLTVEMLKAAEGTIPALNVFGGSLTVKTSGGRPTVIAGSIPIKPCITTSWQLVRKGLLTINGATPARVSAAKIMALCSSEGDFATITWTPDAPSAPEPPYQRTQ